MLKKRISLKTFTVLAWLVDLATLVPVLYIGRYDYPSADDFGMGNPAYQALQSGGVLSAIGAAAYMAWYDYINWMGYFTSTFLMSFPPSIFGETVYAVGVWIIIATLTFAVCYFLHALLVKALHADRYAAGIASAAVLFLMVQCMPEGMARVEAFYWYCSAANYLLTFSMALIFLGLLISVVCDRKKGKKIYDFVMACILSFWIGGGNYLSALSCAILVVLLLVAILFCKKISGILHEDPDHSVEAHIERRAVAVQDSGVDARWLRLLVIPCLLMLAGFAASCLAPGNDVRASGLESTGPVKTILICLHYTLEYCCSEWTNWAVVCIFALLAPVFWHETGRERVLAFRYPILAVVFGYGMVAANICPPMLAESNIGAGRLQALFWMQYVLVMVLLEWYLIGWLHRFAAGRQEVKASVSQSRTGSERLGAAGTRMIAFTVVLLLFGSALSVKAEPDTYTFTAALHDLRNGSAQAYGEENAARRALLRDPSVQDVVLESYAHEPTLLFFTDIDESADGWQNQALARYYHKNSVTRTPNKRLEDAD